MQFFFFLTENIICELQILLKRDIGRKIQIKKKINNNNNEIYVNPRKLPKHDNVNMLIEDLRYPSILSCYKIDSFLFCNFSVNLNQFFPRILIKKDSSFQNTGLRYLFLHCSIDRAIFSICSQGIKLLVFSFI